MTEPLYLWVRDLLPTMLLSIVTNSAFGTQRKFIPERIRLGTRVSVTRENVENVNENKW